MAAGRPVPVNPLSVAKEAGLSRAPLYTEAHQEVLAAIQVARTSAAGAATASRLSNAERTAELRDQIDRLKSDKQKLATENMALLVEVDGLRQEVERLKAANARLTKKVGTIKRIGNT